MSHGTFRCAFLLGPESIEIRELATQEPAHGELLVAIDAATTCGTDVKVYRRGGHPRMLTTPCPFGHEIAATVVETGAGVSGWQPGDRVVVANSASCGACDACTGGRENLCVDLQYLNGAFADCLIVPERFTRRSVYRRPDGLPPPVAAMAEPLACVVHGLERMDLPSESEVLVLGGGPIGQMFVYLLAAGGHRAVMADPHDDRLELSLALGAGSVARVDNRDEPLSDIGRSATSTAGFTAAVDATGTPAAWESAIAAVRPGGVVNLFGGCAEGTEITVDTHHAHYGELTLLGSYHHRPATFARALEVLSAAHRTLDRLVSYECGLSSIEDALGAMIDRRAIKVAVRPGSSARA